MSQSRLSSHREILFIADFPTINISFLSHSFPFSSRREFPRCASSCFFFASAPPPPTSTIVRSCFPRAVFRPFPPTSRFFLSARIFSCIYLVVRSPRRDFPRWIFPPPRPTFPARVLSRLLVAYIFPANRRRRRYARPSRPTRPDSPSSRFTSPLFGTGDDREVMDERERTESERKDEGRKWERRENGANEI